MADTKGNGSAAPAGQPATKGEAVARALKALGPDAQPTQIGEYLRREFNLVLTNPQISYHKHDIQRKGKRARRRKSRAEPAPKPAAPKPRPAAGQTTPAPAPAAPAPAPKPASTPAGAVSLGDIRAAKELVGRVGAGPLKALIDLLGG